jgi:integration host factor subunit beta
MNSRSTKRDVPTNPGNQLDSHTQREFVTRAELIAAIAARFSWMDRADAKVAVDAILDGIAGALIVGRRVEIRGFGTFTRVERSGRLGRNPKNGAPIDVPPKRAPHFKPFKILRDRVD